ncbi:7,8-dihydro-8-oxoguanine-triphosphatase mutT [Halorhodospira halochloris]|uniref:7,8-dihydro-8-oxoguanine-triphosphatase mutT n=1 Tax=Halorhodospira halochloris TaxID=1052 RepID=A0A0X8XAG5_HALHR|nr:7,8-dihydro-8-oxoguanine-triphosphatase mutT [Halorhodospira halochloris]
MPASAGKPRQLPDFYLITPTQPDDWQAWLDLIRRSFFDPGVGWLQMRRHDLDDQSFLELATELYALCRENGIPMLVNREPWLAEQIAADGLHLSESRLFEKGIEQRLRPFAWVGASCHGVESLQRAADIGVDFAVLSPVHSTPSHPGRQPIGWQGFAATVAQVDLPVYALGGVAAADLHTAKVHGAQGIAAIRGLLP